MKDFFELEVCIESLADDNGTLIKEDRIEWAKHIKEESQTLYNIIADGNEIDAETKTTIGLVMAKLIILAKLSDTSLEECLDIAYNKLIN